jgi:AraC-like DNA-binding protein
VATVAALLPRRPSLLAIRRALPRQSLRVLTARSPSHLANLLLEQRLDGVVVGLEAARGATFEALRTDFPSLPVMVFGPVRSDDAGTVRHFVRRGVALVAIEQLDEPILARMVRGAGFTARRERALLPLAGRLGLVDDLQQRAWARIVADPVGLTTAALARELGVARETLSRRFAEGPTPTLKAAVDAVRLVAAGQLLGSPGWRVADTARLLGFSSVSLFQRTCRRITGVSARALGSLPPERILARLIGAPGRRWG